MNTIKIGTGWSGEEAGRLDTEGKAYRGTCWSAVEVGRD